jgi:hypothetical protein
MDELSKAVTSSLRGMSVVDADTPISERDDLWTSRATPSSKIMSRKSVVLF